MKFLFLAVSFLLASRVARAQHAYATDDCVGKTLNNSFVKIGLGNDVPAAPHRLYLEEDDNDHPIWVAVGSDTDEKDSGLTLRKISETKTGSKNVGDECFVGKGYTSVRKYRVEASKKNVVDALALRKGDVIYLSCYTDHSEPSGSGCDR